MVLNQHGDTQELVYDPNFPDPEPGPREVVVRVKATSINYHDLFTLRGMPGIKIPFPMIIGLDVAGTISEISEDVDDWRVGDRVLIDPRDRINERLVGETMLGGLAEYCLVPDYQLIRIPQAVSFDQAACLPVAFGTAHRMIRHRGCVEKGEKVLILGASGGVGTGALLLSKMAGAEVTVCASSDEKLSKLAALGADHLINYKQTDFLKEAWKFVGKPQRRSYDSGYDVVVNFTGGDTWVNSIRCLKTGGRMLTCGATAGFDPKTDLRFVWTFELDIKGSNSWETQDLNDLLDLVEQQKIDPPIDAVFPLENAQHALAMLEDRNVCGKVIIKP